MKTLHCKKIYGGALAFLLCTALGLQAFLTGADEALFVDLKGRAMPVSVDAGKMTVLEALMRKDAAQPLPGYFASCHKYMIENPDQIGIHLKRKKKDDQD